MSANPALSEQGDILLAKARASEGGTAAMQGADEVHDCIGCKAEGSITPATHKCEDCGDAYFCGEFHAPPHAKRTKHSLVLLKPGSIDPASIRLLLSNCGKHGFPLDMYCVDRDCLTAVCAKCALSEHKTHNLKGIDEVTDLAPKVRAFLKASQDSAVAAAADVKTVADARERLGAARQRVITEVRARKTTALQQVSDRFDHLIALVDTEASERDKALASQARERTVVAAQLVAAGLVCDTALEASNNVVLASALHAADVMKPMLTPFSGLVAAIDMDMVLDLQPLTTALDCLGHFVQFPVDPATSEVTSGTIPAVVDEAVAAAGGADAVAEEGVPVDTVKTIKLIPRGAAGNIVQLREDEVRLSVCDAEGREVGTSTVAVHEDYSVNMDFSISDMSVTQPVFTVFVRDNIIMRWTSRRLVSFDFELCICSLV